MTKPRRLLYLTGTRADFGLMARTLQLVDQDPALELSLAVTGMHLSPLFGETITDVRASGLPIAAELPVTLEDGTPLESAQAVASILAGLSAHMDRERPDALVLLGDRGEMLAGAIAAVHLNVPIFHLHGGERSGTIDESIRHAISKLAHYHFTSTRGAWERLVRMGEDPAHVFVTGAPGLDDTLAAQPKSRAEIFAEFDLDPDRTTGLMVFHPVVQSEAEAGTQVETLLQAALDSDLQLIALAPNSDAGSQHIRAALARFEDHPKLRLRTHLARGAYLALMARVDVMLGNSSSGILEAASFGTPVVNAGDRQTGRERNSNTIDVPVEAQAVRRAIAAALEHGRHDGSNIYGDGHAAPRIRDLLRDLPLSPDLLNKIIRY